MIQENHDLRQIILDSLPELIILIDANTWKIHYVNEPMAQSLGASKHKLIGQQILDLFPPKVAAKRKKYAEQAIQTGKPLVFEDTRDQRWFENSFYPIKDSKGTVIYGLAAVREITKQKTKSKKQLETQQDFFISLIQNTSDLIVVTDRSGTIQFASPSATHIFGYHPQEIITKNLSEFIHPQEKQLLNQFRDLHTKKDQILRVEHRIKHKNGSYRYCESIAVNKLSTPSIKGIIINTRDITEKKKAEQTIQQSEKRYRYLINNINDGIVTIDRNGNFTFINQIIEKRSGIPAAQWKKLNIMDIIYPEYQKTVKHNLSKILAGTTIAPFELAYKTASGKKIYVEINAQPIIEHKKVIGIQGITRDITDRKHALETLKESEEMYRTLMQTSPDPIILTDLTGTILMVSEQACQLYGTTSPDEIIGMNVFSLVHPADLQKAKEILQAVLEKGYVKNIQLRVKNKQNHYYYTETNAGLLQDSHGKPKAFVGIFRDISKRKKIEEEKKRSYQYLEKVIDSTSDIIFAVNQHHKITIWNRTAEQMTGIKRSKVYNRTINTIDIFQHPRKLSNIVESVLQGKPSCDTEMTIKTEDGYHHLQFSTSLMRDEKDQPISVLFTARDITENKKIIKKLQSGRGYLLIDTPDEEVTTIFQKLTSQKNPGLYITRPHLRIPMILSKKPYIIFRYFSGLSKNKHHIVTSLPKLTDIILDFVSKNENSVVLLDRFDYLIARYDFHELMTSIYDIQDAIFYHNAILFLHITERVLRDQQLAFLEEEFAMVPKVDMADVEISEDLFSILVFIRNHSSLHEQISYTRISKAFHISKTTTSKRIAQLQTLGLIHTRKYGRMKLIKLGQKGELLLTRYHNKISQ